MNTEVLKQIDFVIGQGVAKAEQKNMRLARARFREAVRLTDKIEKVAERRKKLNEIAQYYSRWHLNDLALEAILPALLLHKKGGLADDDLSQDLLDYGNIQMNVNNLPKAVSAYKKAIEVSVASKKFSNAASASTNIAMLYANHNHVREAIELLDNSLKYLQETPFPRTEFITRFTYLQLAGFEEVDDKKVMDLAEGLDGFGMPLPPEHIGAIAVRLNKAITNYCKANKGINREKLIAEKFPWLPVNTFL